jgi:hypothetical protein
MLEGRDLLTSLCFYDQTLLCVELTTTLLPPGERDWSHYSLDVEAATKEFHDQVLEQTLGNPSRSRRMPVGDLRSNRSTLARPLTWIFRWGKVMSFHDSIGGGTYIRVSYGNRLEQACRAYRSAHE